MPIKNSPQGRSHRPVSTRLTRCGSRAPPRCSRSLCRPHHSSLSLQPETGSALATINEMDAAPLELLASAIAQYGDLLAVDTNPDDAGQTTRARRLMCSKANYESRGPSIVRSQCGIRAKQKVMGVADLPPAPPFEIVSWAIGNTEIYFVFASIRSAGAKIV